jgi:hypothetical protein
MHFLDLAADLAPTGALPLMLTGAITRRDTAEKVLAGGVAPIGGGGRGVRCAVTVPRCRPKGISAVYPGMFARLGWRHEG